MLVCLLVQCRCFNPHTHEGCDARDIMQFAWDKVSIHTPTKGVTAAIVGARASAKFQSTHPRRV